MTTSGAMPTAKRVSQSALWSLKEALASIYWYKSDLESFLRATVSRPEVLVRLNFNEPKRGVVGALVDCLAADQDRYLGDLLELMCEVTAFEDFAHLARLEDGTLKAARRRSPTCASTTNGMPPSSPSAKPQPSVAARHAKAARVSRPIARSSTS